jgi:hypothetical protein
MSDDFQSKPPRWGSNPYADVDLQKPAMPGVGVCRHCGLGPVARDVRTCPRCHGKFPNPSVFVRSCDRGVKIGLLLGVGTGLIWGLSVVGGVVGFLLGIMLGPLPEYFWACSAVWSGERRRR